MTMGNSHYPLNYPLRIDGREGMYYIKDPVSAADMFDLIVPPSLSVQIGDQ
jgi:hypothetical protein